MVSPCMAQLASIAIKRGDSQVNEVVYYKDSDLQKRWRCSGMKLWRMRKAGKLNSIQIGGCGSYLTSDAEIARIESQPVKAKDAA